MINPSDKTAGMVPTPAYKDSAQVTLFSKKVMIILPWFKQVSPITAFCAAQLIDRRRTATLLNWGDAFIAHTRNHCAEIFLNSPCDYALWLDDDMVCPFGNAEWFRMHTGFDFPEPFMALNTLDRLMSHGKTLVGALYFGRHKFGPPVVNEGANKEFAYYCRKGPHDKIAETRWVGTGCLLTHRSVFESIEKTFPRLSRGPSKSGGNWFTSTEASLLDNVQRIRDALAQGGQVTAEKSYKALEGLDAALALASNENALGNGEDVSFCLRAKAAGHTPHVDLGLICGHLGHCVFGPHNTGNKPPMKHAH